MSLENYLNSIDFYSYAGFLSSAVNDDYVNFVIAKMNSAINQKLSNLFTFTRSQVNKYYLRNSSGLIIIGNWQEGGGVDVATITAAGTGFTSVPVATVSGDGTGATAEVVIDPATNEVTEVNITNPGRDYTTATVAITGGGGSGATATVTVSPDLIVKIKDEGSTEEETLVIGEDYRLEFYKEFEPERVYPVTAINLYFERVWETQNLEITGTYGFSGYIPNETMLDVELYDLLKNLILSSENDTNTGGKGKIKSSKIGDITTSFDGGDDTSNLSTKGVLKTVNEILAGVSDSYKTTPGYYTSVIL